MGCGVGDPPNAKQLKKKKKKKSGKGGGVHGHTVNRDVTNQTLPGRVLLNYSPPGRVWLVTNPAGDGKNDNLLYSAANPPKMIRTNTTENLLMLDSLF